MFKNKYTITIIILFVLLIVFKIYNSKKNGTEYYATIPKAGVVTIFGKEFPIISTDHIDLDSRGYITKTTRRTSNYYYIQYQLLLVTLHTRQSCTSIPTST